MLQFPAFVEEFGKHGCVGSPELFVIKRFYHDEGAFDFQSHERRKRSSTLTDDKFGLCIPVLQMFVGALPLQANCCLPRKFATGGPDESQDPRVTL